MFYPFSKTPMFRRTLALSLVLVMAAASLTGCFAKKEPEATDPSVDMPNLVDPAETTEPTEPETTEPTTEPVPDNIAVVKEQLSVRSIPSTSATVVATLDAGEQVPVLRVDDLHGIPWAYIRLESLGASGWVTASLLDMSNVSEELFNSTSTPAGGDSTTATDATTPKETTPSVTGSGTMGVVTASELNVREEPNSSSARKGMLTYGTRVSITETKDGWGRTKDGWISMNYVYVDGQRGKNTCNGTVTASQLIVREGPGTNYNKVSTLNQGAKVEILEQIKVGNSYWGCTSAGWVSMSYISGNGNLTETVVNNDTTNNNTTTDNGIGTATVTAHSGLTIRSGAGTDYEVLGGLKFGDTVTVLSKKQVGDQTWGEISKGWICLDYTKMN